MKPFSARGVERKLLLMKKKDENLSCWDHIDRNCKIFWGKDDADFKKKMVRQTSRRRERGRLPGH